MEPQGCLICFHKEARKTDLKFQKTFDQFKKIIIKKKRDKTTSKEDKLFFKRRKDCSRGWRKESPSVCLFASL